MSLIRSMLFFLTVLFLFNSCENNEGEISRITSRQNDPVEEIIGLKTIYSDSGSVKVLLEAPSMKKVLIPKHTTELPKGMVLSFYDADMKVVSKMSSSYAIHYDQEHRWEARNNVEVVNFVKITTAKEIIMGNGFEADQDFSHYKIFNVTGHITLNE